MVDVVKRKADRLRVMKAIFDASDGSEQAYVSGPQLTAELGLKDEEMADACHFLAGEGLIEESKVLYGSPVPYTIKIRHLGIKEMEQSLQAPNKPTEHFPPAISVIHIEGDVIGSPIQSGSPGAQQKISFGDLDLGAVREFIRQFDALEADLDLPTPVAKELTAEIDTIKAQLRSPKPKLHVIKESLLSARAILEIATGTVAAVGLLDLLKLIHL